MEIELPVNRRGMLPALGISEPHFAHFAHEPVLTAMLERSCYIRGVVSQALAPYSLQ